MKRLFFAVPAVGAMLLTGTLRAQDHTPADNLHSTFQVTVITPVGTNGRSARHYTNDISLNILAGVSAGERRLTLAGIGNVVLGDVRGFQAASVFNLFDGNGAGASVSGAVNFVRGDYTGAQFSGVVNFARDLTGAQFSGAVDFARDISRGAQFSGAVNAARDIDRGAQLSGALNFARDIDRVAQFAGAVNVARDVRGLQMAGAVNVARDVRGVQIASVLNIARKSDYPIGLINIIREGEMSIGLGYNDIGTSSVNFRSGGRVLYGIVGAGFNDRAADNDGAVSFIGGIGAHINVTPRFRINNELTSEHITRFDKYRSPAYFELLYSDSAKLSSRSDDNDSHNGAFKAGYALLPAFRFGSFEIFGGPSINYLNTCRPDMYGLWSGGTLWDKVGGRRYRLQQLFIGWQVGAQFILK